MEGQDKNVTPSAEMEESIAGYSDVENQDEDEAEARELMEEEHRALLQRMTKRLEKARTACAANRAEARLDVQFRRGGDLQWDAAMLQARRGKRRPTETFNGLPRFIHEIVNTIRMDKPMIKVSTDDKVGSAEVAQLLEDHLRKVEHESDADIAYDTAAEHAAERGEGFIAIDPVEVEEGGQVVVMPRIFRVADPFMEFPDPDARKPDASDALYWFSIQPMDEDDFAATWPDPEQTPPGAQPSDPNLRERFAGMMNRYLRWRQRSARNESLDIGVSGGPGLGKVYIARYFEVVDDVVPPVDADAPGADRKPMPRRRVMMHWVTKDRVLESVEWLGRWIPRARVVGTEINDNGQRITEGVIRHARGYQRMQNYAKCTALEDLGLYARNPPLIPDGSITGYEQDWKRANEEPVAYLTYKPYDEENRPLPPPVRPSPAPPSTAAMMLGQDAAAGLFDVTGIPPVSLVQDKSARGQQHELARQRKGEVATFHYADNLARAMRHVGRILVDALPNYLDSHTEIMGLTQANAPRVEKIGPTQDNQPVQVDYKEEGGREVMVKTYNLKVGRYRVYMDAGPSLPTRKLEAQSAVLDMIRTIAPPGSKVALGLAPLLARNMDIPDAETLYEVLLANLPPELQAVYNKEMQGDIERVAALQQQQLFQAGQAMQQMQAMIQQLSMRLHDRQEEHMMSMLEAKLKFAGERLRSLATIESSRMKAVSHLRGKVLDHAAARMPSPQEMVDRANPPEPTPTPVNPSAPGGNPEPTPNEVP
ncbi:MAG: hypothetical protein OEV94_12085 [Deltaproteobacteria bacterium]|nr:hypothetical protein [Deltaproteobacteria bacterium]